jgi:hypothetical protein
MRAGQEDNNRHEHNKAGQQNLCAAALAHDWIDVHGTDPLPNLQARA